MQRASPSTLSFCWGLRYPSPPSPISPLSAPSPTHPPTTQARWLVLLMQRGPDAAKEAFSLIPESVVRDMTAWLRCACSVRLVRCACAVQWNMTVRL